MEPDRSVVVILEDIDELTKEDTDERKLLNILDGINQSENIVFIATTNYPDKLKERIINRSSRFDRRYELKLPNKEVREFYLRNKLKKSDLEKLGEEELTRWINETEGLTLAHLDELIVLIVILGNEFDYVLKKLLSMGEKLKASDQNYSKAGF